MTTRLQMLARTRDEPLFAALGLILAAERLIDAKATPHIHRGVVNLIEAVRAEIARPEPHDRRG